MSPHYEADPAEKVWVPREKWFEPPAKAGETSKAGGMNRAMAGPEEEKGE
jgi:hypothetical protein